MRPSEKEIEEENRKMRYLRTVVDFTVAILRQGNLSIPEAVELIAAAKRHVLSIFPDKEGTYDLIYKPRFERIIQERLGKN